jgi:hypothetical protein
MSLTETMPQSHQKRAVAGRSARLRVTGKLKTAIDYLVFNGSKTDLVAAAQHAGIAAQSIRSALMKPHVKAYYQQQIEVLRSGERARNVHRLIEIRDAADNMPAVQAIKALEGLEDQQLSRGSGPAVPGLVVVIQTAPDMTHIGNIDAKPLIDNEPDSER